MLCIYGGDGPLLASLPSKPGKDMIKIGIGKYCGEKI